MSFGLTFLFLLSIICRNQCLELEIKNLKERFVLARFSVQYNITNFSFVIKLCLTSPCFSNILAANSLNIAVLNPSYERQLQKKTAEVQHHVKR